MARTDVYQAVTDRIIEALDRGVVPWRMPFKRGGGSGLPKNLKSGKGYRGINILLLATTAMARGFESDFWVTFKQAKERGGTVKKGEKSSLVVFWKQLDVKDKDTGKDKKVPMLRYYNVFNAQQCDGLDVPDHTPLLPEAEEEPFTPLSAVGTVFENYHDGPALTTGSKACYSPTDDRVTMPEASRFENAQRHAATLFHELVHSTGHSKRLDRGLDTKLAPFGSPDYSKEELVAEMGAAFLCAHNGISSETLELSASYIDNWRRVLKADNKAVVQASGLAQRAVDHILGVSWDQATERSSPPTATTATGNNLFATNDNPAPQDQVEPNAVATVPLNYLADLKADHQTMSKDLQAFPRPGQANLCSTATSEERSRYIKAVLGWWNQRVDGWHEAGIIDPDLNPTVRPSQADVSPQPGQ